MATLDGYEVWKVFECEEVVYRILSKSGPAPVITYVQSELGYGQLMPEDNILLHVNQLTI